VKFQFNSVEPAIVACLGSSYILVPRPVHSALHRCVDVAAQLRFSANSSVQKDTECHHIVVEDWATMQQPRGCLFVSIPSLLDDSLAPDGFHTFHAFAPEYVSEYAGLKGAAYKAKKEEHADEIIDRLEAVFPGLRAAIVFREVLNATLLACAGCFGCHSACHAEICSIAVCSDHKCAFCLRMLTHCSPTMRFSVRFQYESKHRLAATIRRTPYCWLAQLCFHRRFSAPGCCDCADWTVLHVQVGSPRTHQKFLNREDGSYGPIPMRPPMGILNMPFNTTDVQRLYCAGDSTFPGQGVNAVVFSGFGAAHRALVDQGKEKTWPAVDRLFNAALSQLRYNT
jgi:hypothetical protein